MKKTAQICLLLIALLAVADTICAEEQQPLLPLGRSWAGDQELPLPFGLGVTYYWQQQDYTLARLTANVGNTPLNFVHPDGIDVANRTAEEHVKCDAWLLPFLNVFGMIGAVEARTEVRFGGPIASAMGTNSLSLDYSGTVFGGGATLAAGVRRLFGVVTATYTATSLKQTDASVNAWVVTPRVGVSFPEFCGARTLSMYAGAMYQKTDERHSGTMVVPGIGSVEYDVDLQEKDEWNYLAGVSAEIS